MKLGTMLADVARSLFQRPATRRYPTERPPTSPRFHGPVHWDPERCTGCRICVMDCPADALELFTIDKATRRFVMRYDVACCTFCAQCVASCNHGCLSLSNGEWELAGPDRGALVSHFGSPSDVAQVVAAARDADAGEPRPG